MLFSQEIKAAIEGLLFITNEPLSIKEISELVEVECDEVKELLAEIKADFAQAEHGITVLEAAGGYMLATKASLKTIIEKLYKPQLSTLSMAALETLAIIAYKQPITRGEIELLRGVKVDKIIHALTEKSLIEEQGRKDSPGRPILYGTTKEFLCYFGLNGLADLPQMEVPLENSSLKE